METTYTVMKAKLPKLSPPLPSEEGGALPGTNTSSTDPEVYVSLFHNHRLTRVLWEEKQGVPKAKCVRMGLTH